MGICEACNKLSHLNEEGFCQPCIDESILAEEEWCIFAEGVGPDLDQLSNNFLKEWFARFQSGKIQLN